MINTFLSVGMILFAKVISISKSKIEKAFCIIMIIVYYALIILSDGRIGMMNASIILFCIILRFAAVKLKYLVPTLIGMLSILCLGICFLLSDSPIKKDITVLKKNNPREYIWKDGIELIKESPIIAKGASTNALRVKEKLLNDEELKKIETFLIKRLNEDKVYAMHTHNQLMQSWQEYGLIGVFAIVALFVSIFLYAKSSLSMFILFSMISIQLMTDVIDGSVGNLGFSMYIYLMFILISSKQVGKEKISSPKEALSAPSNT
jgi:O-antigen ligase